jgi:hypothetical protein
MRTRWGKNDRASELLADDLKRLAEALDTRLVFIAP